MKLTPWFPVHSKPVRVGVYEIFGGYYSYWSGRFWVATDATPQFAADPRFFDLPSCTQDKKWRGLAERPAK